MECYLVYSDITILFHCKTDKGVVSLAYPCRYTMNCYEIYCIEGDLFEDIERFETISEALARINELLKPA